MGSSGSEGVGFSGSEGVGSSGFAGKVFVATIETTESTPLFIRIRTPLSIGSDAAPSTVNATDAPSVRSFSRISHTAAEWVVTARVLEPAVTASRSTKSPPRHVYSKAYSVEAAGASPSVFLRIEKVAWCPDPSPPAVGIRMIPSTSRDSPFGPPVIVARLMIEDNSLTAGVVVPSKESMSDSPAAAYRPSDRGWKVTLKPPRPSSAHVQRSRAISWSLSTPGCGVRL